MHNKYLANENSKIKKVRQVILTNNVRSHYLNKVYKKLGELQNLNYIYKANE